MSRLVITLKDGAVSAVLTDNTGFDSEVTVIDFDQNQGAYAKIQTDDGQEADATVYRVDTTYAAAINLNVTADDAAH